MKRIFIFLLIIFTLGACSVDTESPVNNKYEIIYDNCGIGNALDKVSNVDTILDLPVLFSDEYLFLGWYLDSDYKEKASIGLEIESNIILYAKWEKLAFTEGIEYILSDDGLYYIVVYLLEEVKDLVIPSVYNGLPVKEIDAIMNVSSLETVRIPSSVEKLNDYAFSNNSNLKSIIIGSGLKEISKYAFCNTPKLESIIIDPANQFIESIDNCIIDKSSNILIKGCKSSVIPNSVKVIEKYAFYGCSELKYIVIPDNVTTINESAFHSCTSLETIVISEKLEVINNFAFTKCESLKTIYNNSSLVFTIGEKINGNIALNALNVYNKGEWSFVNGTPTPNN